MHCILQSKHIVIRSCEHIFGCLEPMTVHEVKPDKYCLLLKLHFQSRDKLEMEKATLHVTFFSLNLETSGDTCIIFTKKNVQSIWVGLLWRHTRSRSDSSQCRNDSWHWTKRKLIETRQEQNWSAERSVCHKIWPWHGCVQQLPHCVVPVHFELEIKRSTSNSWELSHPSILNTASEFLHWIRMCTPLSGYVWSLKLELKWPNSKAVEACGFFKHDKVKSNANISLSWVQIIVAKKKVLCCIIFSAV